jgi:hypothetical protein
VPEPGKGPSILRHPFCVFFPKAYNQFCFMLNEMRPYVLKGKVEQDFTAVTLTVHWIEFLDRHNQGNQLLLRSKTPSGHA